MRWLPLAVLGVVAGLFTSGCEKTIYRSHDSHYCSSTEDDDPYYECSRGSDLVCVNTFSKTFPQSDGRPDKVVPMWLCRLACTPPAGPTDKGTCLSDEICCPGQIYGRDYGKKHACVPIGECEAIPPMAPVRDAGRDTMASDGGSDGGTSADVPADLAPVDVPQNPDAPDAL